MWFERLYVASTIAGLMNLLISYGELRQYAVSRGTAAAGPAIALLITVTTGVLFWFFIARRGSNAAKWILVILTALNLLDAAETARFMRALSPIYSVTLVTSVALLFASLTMLFRTDAVEWLRSDKRPPVDPGVFN